jgi:hypothetical protein
MRCSSTLCCHSGFDYGQLDVNPRQGWDVNLKGMHLYRFSPFFTFFYVIPPFSWTLTWNIMDTGVANMAAELIIALLTECRAEEVLHWVQIRISLFVLQRSFGINGFWTLFPSSSEDETTSNFRNIVFQCCLKQWSSTWGMRTLRGKQRHLRGHSKTSYMVCKNWKKLFCHKHGIIRTRFRFSHRRPERTDIWLTGQNNINNW